MRKLLEPFNEQYDSFFSELEKKGPKTIFGTLGPSGTSSNYALEYLLSYIKEVKPDQILDTKLKNKFEDVFSDLAEGNIDYAFVPSAYERITDYYWYPDFSNVLNFLYAPPPYGVICKVEFDYTDFKGVLRVASCSAVENILLYVNQKFFNDFERVHVLSTMETVAAVAEGRAHLGITNQTSFDRNSDKGIRFISEKFYTRVVFSVFARKSRMG